MYGFNQQCTAFITEIAQDFNIANIIADLSRQSHISSGQLSIVIIQDFAVLKRNISFLLLIFIWLDQREEYGENICTFEYRKLRSECWETKYQQNFPRTYKALDIFLACILSPNTLLHSI